MTSFFNKLQRGLKVCFAALCMLLTASPATVHAYDFTINGISYDVLSYDELRCEVADVFTKADGAIKIPDTVEFDGRTFRITSIGGYAFDGCRSITSIQLPDGITSIGSCAFRDCSSLTSLQLPEGVTSIGNETFYGCSSLTSLQLPNSVTSIGSGAFDGCSSLTSLKLPDGVKSIGESAFLSCSSLTSLQIPDGVTSIGDYAFGGCWRLKELVLPKSLESLGRYIFEQSIDDYSYVKLSKLVCSSMSPPRIDSWYTFPRNYNFFSDVVLYVPKGSLEAYREADRWKNFDSIVEYDLEDGIDEVVAPGAERKEVGRYDLSGREVDGSHKGITIVRYDDGSATKIYQD